MKDQKTSRVATIAAVISILGVGLAWFQFVTGKQSLAHQDPVMEPIVSTPVEPAVSPQTVPEKPKVATEDPKADDKDPKMVRATGYSAPGQSVYAARLAAEMDAKRQLADAVHGALIKASARSEEGVVKEAEMEMRVNALLLLAQKVSEERLADGSFKVVMEAPLQARDKP